MCLFYKVSLAPSRVCPLGFCHHTCSAASSTQITGVSVLRAGETMEPALRAVCKDVRIGKILIQTNLDSGEPEVNKMTHSVPNAFIIGVFRTLMFASCLGTRHKCWKVSLNSHQTKRDFKKNCFDCLFFFVFLPHDVCLRGYYPSCFCNHGNCLLLSGLTSCITCVCPKTSVRIMSS